ncbi:MAG: OmpA family protein [Acidobacteriota bacterium]|nr:OmpA family protein [Acidobacteriota bacterium]MDP3717737.1 OmpA family protein [Acidobacteriota bacterium]
MRKSLFVVGIITILGVAPACATKGFVRTSVGEVNDKVATMGTSLEETQERVRTAEGKIVEVDGKAVAANEAAAKANAAAADAANKAAEVGTTAERRAAGIEAETRKLIFETVLSEDQGKFRLGKADLPEDAAVALDAMVNNLKADKKAVWVEIEGHTDNVGDAKYNEQLGLMRAEAVKRYLYEKHQVPLHKINVISYGEEKPVAPNNTRDGRAQNRRVVIKVLA